MSERLQAGHLWGQTRASLESSGLVLSRTHYAPGIRVPAHSHSNAGFCFVLRGNLTRTYLSGEHDSSPGTISFHPAGEIHSEQVGSAGVVLFSIQLSDEWVGRLGGERLWIDDRYRTGPGEQASSIARRLWLESEDPDDLTPLSIEGLMLELAVAVRRAEPRHDSGNWLSRVDDFIRDSFHEPIGLTRIAASVGLHPSHLARAWRERRRETIGDTIRRVRIEHACRRLRAADSPSLAEVALEAGFSSQGHFTTTFRRVLGVTPRQYLARLH